MFGSFSANFAGFSPKSNGGILNVSDSGSSVRSESMDFEESGGDFLAETCSEGVESSKI